MLNRNHFFILFVFISVILQAQGVTYFVNSNNGNNENSGLTTDSAWQDLTNVNNTTFQPGDSLLFAANSFYTGLFSPKGSGSLETPFVIDKYDEGNDPLFIGFGIEHVLYLYNQEYITVRNLEITNSNVNNERDMLRGIYILGRDVGTLHNIKLQNLYIHNVSGSLRAGNLTKENGGIYYEILGDSIQTKFDSLIIEGCRIIDVDRVGISNKSSWWVRTLTTNTNWYPSTNIIIRNNHIERTGGNGLIIRESSFALIEHNVFKQCGLKVNGNAMFTFNCDDAIIQYNESSETVYNEGDIDASGFDGDFRCKRTLFQYNYSHDNDGGFMVVVCMGGETRFNDSCVVRYNISQNDGGKVFHISGQTTNTFIYNNTIFLGGNQKAAAVDHTSWDSWPDNTFYYNNIFINTEPEYGEFIFNSSTNNFFDHNLFYGFDPDFLPIDTNKIVGDPKLINPGVAISGINNLEGYMLEENSPAINSGRVLDSIGSYDYFGNPLPFNNLFPDRGAHEYQGLPSGIKLNRNVPGKFDLYQNYPNPFNPSTIIEFNLPKEESVNLKVFDILGEEVDTILDERLLAGNHSIEWKAESESAGVYFYKLSVGNSYETKGMILLE